jgi:predicted amidohydrolase YtcJ
MILKKRIGYLSFLLLIIFSSCNYKRTADKIFYNGTVYSVDNNFSVSEAFAIEKGRIKEVGRTAEILDDFESAEMIDLHGATVFPGFIDAHCHFYGYATDLMKCDLYGTTSFEDVINRVVEYSKTNTFSWILGRGWDQNAWNVKVYPSKEILDSLFPDIPVFLMRIDGHAALCNTKALTMGGVNTSTKIEGGEIHLKNGELTGMLIDNSVDVVKTKIPPFSPELIEQAILKAQANCFEVGLTTVDDAGLGKDSIFTLIELQKNQKLKLRVYAMLSDDPKSLEYFFKHGPLKNERMNIRSIKLYADGALGSRGACMKEEYDDKKDHYGFLLHSYDYMKSIAEEALDHGFQLCTHAIGDSAVSVVLDIYTDLLTSDNRRRWRIEHCQVVSPKDLKKFGEFLIIPSVQPTHATSDMPWAVDRIGNARIANAYAYEALRDASEGIIAIGTDFPVESINPIHTFYAAVVRKDHNAYPKNGFLSENKLKRKDAIKGMTSQAAYANFEDEEKGSIEEGKYADFVILDRDLLKIEEEDILKTKVLSTYINGEKVFERK